MARPTTTIAPATPSHIFAWPVTRKDWEFGVEGGNGEDDCWVAMVKAPDVVVIGTRKACRLITRPAPDGYLQGK